MTNCTCELMWLKYLSQELRFQHPPLIVLKYHNPDATYILRNLVFHKRTKHIEIDHQFIREKVLIKI